MNESLEQLRKELDKYLVDGVNSIKEVLIISRKMDEIILLYYMNNSANKLKVFTGT